MNKLLLSFVALCTLSLTYAQNLPSRSNPTSDFRVEYENYNTNRAAGDSCGYVSNAYLALDKVQSFVWWNGAYYGASTGSPSFSEAGQYFTAPQPMRIDGFQIIYYFSPENTATSMPVVGKIYEALSDSTPGALLAVDTIMVSEQTPGTGIANYATFDFDSNPVVGGDGFFLSVRAYTNDSIYFLSNDDGQVEDLSYAYYEDADVPGNSAWVNYLAYGPAYDFDHLFFPIFKTEFTNDFNLSSDTICIGSDICVDATNFAGIIYDSLWNPNAGNDSLYLAWDFGSGAEGAMMKSYCHTTMTPGNMNVSMIDSIYLYNDNFPYCALSVTKQIHVVDSVDASFSWTSTNGMDHQVDFTNASTNADSYIWVYGDGNSDTTDADSMFTYDYASSGNGIYTVTLYASNMCFIDSAEMDVDLSTVSLDEFVVENMKIYPNPSQGKFNIAADFELDNAEIKVINVLGKVVLSKKLNTKLEQVDLSAFGSGTYFFRIETDKNTITRKVVVQ